MPRTPTPVELNQLIALFHAGRYVELESQTRLLLERYPATGLAWKLLCAALQMQGKDALQALQKAAEYLPDDAEAHYNLGNALQDLGQPEAAVSRYRRALKFAPHIAEVHNNLGTALQDLGQLDQAVASYRQALKINPHYTEAYNNLGIALQDMGRLDEAIASYHQALKIKPDYAEAHCGLGIALKDLGKADDAIASYQRALQIKPDYAEAYNNLGNALQDLGQLAEAVASYHRALEIKPNYAEAHNNLGNVLKDLGQRDDALASYRQALQIKPDYAEAHLGLGNLLLERGELDDALASYRQALQIKPDYAEAHNNLGNALKELGQFDDALTSYRQALKIRPDYAEAYNNQGIVLQEARQFDAAIASYQRALEIKPDYAEAHFGLGIVLQILGQLDGALASYRRALEIKPDHLDANRSYLAALLYHPAITVDALFDEHIAFVARMCSSLCEVDQAFSSSRDPARKLRIGYVSSDFRGHPVARNIKPLIEHHDRSKFEVYLYGNVKRPDGMTEWFKGAVAGWRSISRMTDKAAAEMIRRDKIDILVLLAGHFDDNRPLIAAYRSAPVQVSFHDPATSGLKAMDYFITDHALSPRETKEHFTERLIHLPTFYIHAPMINAPDVSPLPAREKGYVTFGSFNNPTKVNEQVVALWSRVLHAVPGSRLILKYQNIFGTENMRRRYFDMFLAHGIEAQQLDLASAFDASEQHLTRYAAIDIALDPFPCTGSTATFEALWMGVPVVTLLGDHWVARMSGAMLKKLKLDELIANDEGEYVKIAQGLAQNLEHLNLLRDVLRERVAKSPLCDEKARAYQIERAFRWMWAKWCAEHSA